MNIILEPYNNGDVWVDDSDYEHTESHLEYDRNIKITGFRRKTDEEFNTEILEL